MDNCLFFSPSNEAIEDIFEKMWSPEVALDFNIEGGISGCLGVLMTPQEDGTIELTQMGLINWILMDETKWTPAEYGCIGKDKEGMERQEEWSKRRVLWMMLCLYNTRADIQLATCARFTTSYPLSRRSHEVALKWIGWYIGDLWSRFDT